MQKQAAYLALRKSRSQKLFDENTPGNTIESGVEGTVAQVLADINGDGNIDLIKATHFSTNKLYLGDGNGGFSATSSDIGAQTDSTRAMIVHDINGDGKLDIIAGNNHDINKLYLGDGTGNFDAPSWIGYEHDRTFSLALADINSDGALDLITGNVEHNRLYLGDGFGGFSATGTIIGSETDITLALALADTNGDGALDLLTGDLDKTNKLYLGDGNGGFSALGTAIGSETDPTYDIELADIDGDGNLDIIAGNSSQTNKLYLGDGSGGFSATGSDIGSETDITLDIVLVDVNGDGELDLITGNYFDQTTKLYLNDGSGGFSATGLDIGSDGDLDLITGNDGLTNKLYEGDGNGGFSATGIDIGSKKDSTWALAMADIERDGDLDLIAGNHGQNKVYQQISYRTDSNTLTSLKINGDESVIKAAKISATAQVNTSTTRNTAIDYYLTNNGGVKWHKVQPDVLFNFPDDGNGDLRWKAQLYSLSPLRSPVLSNLVVTTVDLSPISDVPTSTSPEAQIANTTWTVSGSGQPGASVTVIFPDGTTQTGVVDNFGNYSFTATGISTVSLAKPVVVINTEKKSGGSISMLFLILLLLAAAWRQPGRKYLLMVCGRMKVNVSKIT